MKREKKAQKRRITSEQRTAIRITNSDLVCRDCLQRLDDNGPLYGNTSKCEAYPYCKPIEVLNGEECAEYVKE